MVVTMFQNVINYSVNMADNMMLGRYGQAELSAASVVNQIFFLLNAFMFNFGAVFTVLAAQYWGQKNTRAINRLAGIGFRVNIFVAIIFFVICTVMPARVVGIFTSDAEIIAQGVRYLQIIKYIYIPYAISNMVMDMLRCVETVSISFYMSVSSLVINVVLNYLLIFGKFGCPELGVAGAAIATLAARLVEVAVLIIYLWKVDKKLCFFSSDFIKWPSELAKPYFKIALTIVPAGLAWAIATPIQTALLGLLTPDAIAANAVTSTYYQLLKVVAQAMSTGSGVIIGKTVGKGDFKTARAGARTIELISLGIGLLLGLLLFLFRPLIISIYTLTPEAETLTDSMLLVMCFVIVGMSYEIPLLFGTIRAGGDARFASLCNVICMWCFAMPLAFAAVFWWHLSPLWVVIFIQSEQIIKCIPVFIRIRQYDKWMKIVAR